MIAIMTIVRFEMRRGETARDLIEIGIETGRCKVVQGGLMATGSERLG